MLAEATAAANSLKKNETGMPGYPVRSPTRWIADGTMRPCCSGETQIRTGHLLVALLKSAELRRAVVAVSPEFGKIPVDELAAGHDAIWAGSDEGNLRPMDGSGIAAASSEVTTTPSAKGSTALDRFSQDLTAKAKAGGMDPVLGRDEEVRQIVGRADAPAPEQPDPDRRGRRGARPRSSRASPNGSPLATVPPALRGVRVCVLDVGPDAGRRLDEG